MSVKNVKLRFNLEKENDRRAYDYLQNAEQSYSKAVISVINSYLDRCDAESEENDFLERIIATVREAVQKTSPIGGLLQLIPKGAPQAADDEEALEAIDDFLDSF